MKINLRQFRTLLVLLVTFACFSEAIAGNWRPFQNMRSRMQQRTHSYGNYNQRSTGNRLGLRPGQPLRNIARCAAGVGIRLANGVMRIVQVCAEVLQRGFVLLANGVRMAVSALMRAGHLIFEAGRWVLNGVATFLHGATVVLANGVRVA